MPTQDILELHTEVLSGDLNEKLYERELDLCAKSGGDIQALREGGFNVFQLEQIRQGLDEGLDVSIYQDAHYSWLDMEEIRKGLKQGIDMSRYREAGYTTDQKREIRKGIARGLDVSQYDKKEYLSGQMRQIRFGLMDGLPVVFFNNPAYNAMQMEEIRKGLKSNVDISAYADTDMPYMKMRAVREAMEDGLIFTEKEIAQYEWGVLDQMHKAHMSHVDLKPYVKQGYDTRQLNQIRQSLEEQLDFEPYIRKDMRGESLKEIRLGLETNLDVKVYAHTDYTWQQMRELRMGLEHRVDVTYYTNPLFNSEQMRQIRLGLQQGLDVSRYNGLIYTAYDMKEMRVRLARGEDVGKKLHVWEEIPEHYEDPVVPASMRPDGKALRDAVAREAEALKERKKSGKVPLMPRRDAAEVEQAPEIPAASAIPANLHGGEKRTEETPAPQIDMHGHHLVVSPDKMLCYLSLPKPKPGVTYTEDIIHALLNRSRVTTGVDEMAIKDIIDNARYDEQVVVARGREAVNGKDGYYEYFFDRESTTSPDIDEAGAADFSKVRFFSEVKAGDEIARYHRGEKGQDGYTVTGDVLPARNGLEKPVLKGRGFMLLPDKHTYAAAVSGVVKMDGYELNINRLLTLTDEEMTDKKIDFLGSVWIRCNLEPGAEVIAQGDVIIDTVAESLKIKSGGDVVLKESATGKTQGNIEATGSVAGKNFFNYKIKANGSVFSNSFLHCNVQTEEKIVCFGDNGTIYGGKLEAKLGLECAIIGTMNGTRTTIGIGVTNEMWNDYNESEKKVERIAHELETLTGEQERLAAMHLQTKEQLQWKIKINAAYTIKQKEYDAALKELDEKAAHIRSVEGAEALVSKILYSGTTFVVDESILQITTTKEAETGIVIKGREKHWQRLEKKKS